MISRHMLAALCALQASAVIVDHTFVDGVAGYPQDLMNAIGTQRWFFAHASVGGNMRSGLDALRGSNTGRYQWVTSSVTYDSGAQRAANPPSPTLAGRVYCCNRGNPGWSAKLTIFSNSLAVSGWHIPAADAVMDKMCYIDQAASAANYIAQMTALEALYPVTRLVYITMPLTTDSSSDNGLRNAYNRAVRQHCAAHDKLLFDLADIEAHDTNGVAQTFVSGGVTNQMLWSAYTTDGGHLNALGQQRAALGWYAVGAQIAIPEPAAAGAVAVAGAVLVARRARADR
ncbi:hypothetical protein GX586_09060 [bacterium]|nr:hypothetical protein [bacterium]